MRVLVTGSQGYIGTVLMEELHAAGFDISGIDSGLYRKAALESSPLDQVTLPVDIRQIEREHLEGVDAVVHLAALSNDPLGALRPSLTEDINYQATIRLGQLAKEAGVGKFIFLSTQSIYGISSDNSGELDEFSSVKNPITDYAKTKWRAELYLQDLRSASFACVVLRPATVFGYSPRLRSDIVFNNLLAQAFFDGQITLKSDGKPWRPVIHVKDVCRAISLSLESRLDDNHSGIYNLGIRGGNYTVLELAEAAKSRVPGSRIALSDSPTSDERSYRVSFERAYDELGFEAERSLQFGGEELIQKWQELTCSREEILGSKGTRLQHILNRQSEGSLNEDLFGA